jgi:hypothetical protein
VLRDIKAKRVARCYTLAARIASGGIEPPVQGGKMTYDPVSFWLKSSVMWMGLIRQQQQAYLHFLCGMANAVPHEDSKELAREADSMRRSTAKKPTSLHRTKQRASKSAVPA